jgi:acetyltransferase-like isoleucine patch superfamily enzyme
VLIPREGVNDDTVQLVEWIVREGARVSEGAALAVLQTAKATFDLNAPRAGFLFHLVEAGADVPVGTAVALISESSEKPKCPAAPVGKADGDQVVTDKARALMKQHGLALSAFAGLAVVRADDVQKILQTLPAAASRGIQQANGKGSDGSDWDEILNDDRYREIKDVLTALRRRMRARFNRHVSTGNHLYDRWELARDYGFGEGTSVYDDCLILGDVRVGRNCWIGPYTILDGNHAPLEIGDYVDVGAGTHIYTHNSIERALTGHRAPLKSGPTRIGSCCFISPHSVIAPGTILGDHCFVSVGSYVEGVFPSFSFLSGCPARNVGKVEVSGSHARLRFSPNGHPDVQST